MGGKTDAPFGRLKSHCRAHRAVEPGIDIRFGRPGALVEAAKDHPVGMLKACLERPPDEEPGMCAPSWTEHAVP